MRAQNGSVQRGIENKTVQVRRSGCIQLLKCGVETVRTVKSYVEMYGAEVRRGECT
jgi:hypothetical protein